MLITRAPQPGVLNHEPSTKISQLVTNRHNYVNAKLFRVPRWSHRDILQRRDNRARFISVPVYTCKEKRNSDFE